MDDTIYMPLVELDLRPESDFRSQQREVVSACYGIVSFPRSGHNWLSRMLAEIIKQHGLHHEPACIGKRGGMGRYVGLKAPRPSMVAELSEWYAPFPVVYGSHGHVLHDGYEPHTKLYLWRDFWSVWRSTRKANAETAAKHRENLEAEYEHVCKAATLGGFKRLLEIRRMLNEIERGTAWWGRSLLDCFVKWCKHRWTFRKVGLKISYKELKRDPKGCLRRICDHMGVCDVEEETLDAALRAGSRENMMREEQLYGSPNPFQTVNQSKP